MSEPLHTITIGENTVSIDSACKVTVTSRGETITNVPLREAVMHLMLTQAMSAAVEQSRLAKITSDMVVVEYVRQTPHGPEATRLSIDALPDWAQELYR